MRAKSMELMKQITSFVDQYYSAKHTTPSANEIAQGVGISKATAYRYLVAMNDCGMIEYDGTSRTIVTKMISKFSPVTFSASFIGVIPCGEPETEEENIEEYVSLPVSLFGNGEFYILRATGDSMVDAGIEDGDMIVIKKQNTAAIGDIVVALDENQTNTLKVFAGTDFENKEAILAYCNKEKYGNRQIRVKELVVQGVAKHVIKSLG